MRSLIGIIILGATLVALPAIAEERRHREGRRGGDGAIEYLGLTEEQQEQWRALHTQHREEIQPLLEEGRALQQRVRESLEADEPEVLVGEAVKAVHAHQEKMKAAQATFEAQLSTVLTPEQQEKFEALKAARKADRKGRRRHRMRQPRGEGAAHIQS